MKRVVLIILGLILTALGFWPAGGVKVVQTPEAIENPQMIYINDASVVISWEADRLIYCQKLDTTGVIHWDATGIRVCLSDSSQIDHHMVTDGQDVWFVWQDERSDDGDIYAQKLSGSTGQRLWGDQGKAVSKKSSTQRNPRCAFIEGGNLGVTWEDVGEEPYSVRSQYVLSNGNTVWDTLGLLTSLPQQYGGTPYVVESGTDMIVCWYSWIPEDKKGIFCQKFNQAGDYLFDTTSTPDADGGYLWGIVDDANKGYIILFMQAQGISVQRFDSLGNSIWGSIGVVLETSALLKATPLLQDPLVKYGLLSDSSGGCFAAWGNEIYAQHVDFEGNIGWGLGGLNVWHTPTGYPRAQNYLSITYDGSGGIFVAWDDFGIDSAGTYPTGVLVQRIDKNGAVRFLSNGLSVWLESDVLPDPITYSVPGACIVAWHDSRKSPNSSIYAQIVDTTGKIGSGIEEKPVVNSPLELECRLNLKIQVVSFSWPEGLGNALLSIYDASGRFISKYQLSSNFFVWDCRSQNGISVPRGVYFVNLKISNAQAVKKLVLIK